MKILRKDGAVPADSVIIWGNFALNAENQNLNCGIALSVELRRIVESIALNVEQKKLSNGTARIVAHQEIKESFVLNVGKQEEKRLGTASVVIKE